MAAALSIGSHGESRNNVTVTGSGLSNTTAYNLVITNADGSSTTRPVTSDGSGGFTFSWVPQTAGKCTYSLIEGSLATIVTVVSGSERRS